jgi:hypothetical protein
MDDYITHGVMVREEDNNNIAVSDKPVITLLHV